MAMRPETQLRKASERLHAAREARDAAIVSGRKAGLSLRELAAASGLAVESIRRTLHANGA